MESGEIIMTTQQIIDETKRYLSDKSYNYAILVDGEWGCGKTYFVQHELTEVINKHEQETGTLRKVKYISLYGCKNVQDIQENIMWSLADEVRDKLGNRLKNIIKQKKSKGTVGNILLTSRKIGTALIKTQIPDANLYDMVGNWLKLNQYVLIFDDIERCDCLLNEMFGYINSLVEHEEVKVILVANEKEISDCIAKPQKELQYSVVLNDRIEWPKEEGKIRNNGGQGNEKVDLALLEERRCILFPDMEDSEVYRKTREKIIGVTLKYEPATKEIAQTIIENSDMDLNLKEVLELHMDIFISSMNRYGHHNLRTFQFYLSKIQYLYCKLDKIEIEDDYKSRVLSFLVQDCFDCAIRFKGNVPVPTDTYGKIMYESQKRMVAVKEYVEAGEYKDESFRNEINKYVEEELRKKLSADDPFELLQQQFYFHPQKWCEEKLEEVRQRLTDDKYPFFIYTKLIRLLVDLVDIGFSTSYIAEFKDVMLKNIVASTKPVPLDDDLFYIDNNERKQKMRAIIDELNSQIIIHDKQLKQITIRETLREEKWVQMLMEYTESSTYKTLMDTSVFCKAEVDEWIAAIDRTSVEEIDMFRHWLHSEYSMKVRSEYVQLDLPVLKEVMNRISPEEESDLIKRMNLKWLKQQLERIIISCEQ